MFTLIVFLAVYYLINNYYYTVYYCWYLPGFLQQILSHMYIRKYMAQKCLPLQQSSEQVSPDHTYIGATYSFSTGDLLCAS